MKNFGRLYTISNLLSFIRLLLAIPFWILLNTDNRGPNNYAVILTLIAVITDVMDGYLARKFNQVSEWGKIVDPLADKVCVGIIIIQLFLHGKLMPALFWVIIMRDVIIFIAGIIVTKKIGMVLPSNYLGKGTVLVIGFYIIFLLLDLGQHQFVVNYLFILAILILSIASLVAYGVRAFEVMKGKKSEVI